MLRGFRMLLEDFRGEKFTKGDIIGMTVLAILYVGIIMFICLD